MRERARTMAGKRAVLTVFVAVGLTCPSACTAMPDSGAVRQILLGLECEDPVERGNAIKRLGELPGPRRELVKQLAERMKSRPFLGQWSAGLAAARLGGDAVGALVQFASPLERDANAGEIAIAALARVGRPALPGILKGLREGNPPQRLGLLWALRDMRPGSTQAVPALINALEDPVPLLAWGAQEAIVQVGPQAVPALLAAWRDGHGSNHPSEALARIGARDKRDVAVILEFVGRRARRSYWRSVASAIAWVGGDCSAEGGGTPTLC